jgi:SAM-dependent methyltransferase
MTVDIGNLEQAEAWDGEEGLRWTLDEERYAVSSAGHTGHLLRAAAIEPDHRVLDVGCGCGATTRRAAGLAARGAALGVDRSEQMLTRARQRAAEHGIANVTFLQADAQVHPFEPSSFDVVISKYGAMFFSDPVAAFTNINRAAGPAARLALLAWQELRLNVWVTEVRAALAAGRELPEPPRNAPGPFGLARPDHVRSVLDRAGWTDVQLTEIAEPVWLGRDPEDAFTFVSQMGMTLGLLNGLDQAARDDAVLRLRTMLSNVATDAGVALPSRSWLIEARSR